MNRAWELIVEFGPRGLHVDDEELRPHKAALLSFLRSWPPESWDQVKRCGRPEARLYPLLNRPVATLHDGDGILVSVTQEQAAVALDSQPGRCAFLPWREVAPPAAKDEADAAT